MKNVWEHIFSYESSVSEWYGYCFLACSRKMGYDPLPLRQSVCFFCGTCDGKTLGSRVVLWLSVLAKMKMKI